MQNRVYGNPAENPSESNGQAEVPANVPEDAAFAALYSGRRVSYLPEVAGALRQSEAPKRLLDRYTEAATLLASDLLYWTPKSRAEGWIYKSREELYEETGLTRRRQRHARELLRGAGILEEREVGFRLYYRVRFAGLKPLLRLAAEKEKERQSASNEDKEGPSRHGDPDYSVSHGETEGPSRMARQGSVPPCETTSVSTTGWDSHPGRHQSVDARETEAGEGESRPVGEAPAAAGLIDGYHGEEGISLEDNARAIPSESTPSANGAAREKAGNEGSGREVGANGEALTPEPAPRPPLWTRIRLEMESLSATDISDEARELAEVLAASLGREQADAGLVRVAGYAALHDLSELLAEIEARRYGKVEHPIPYYAKGLAIGIKDEEVSPRTPRSGSPIERFEAALRDRGRKASASATDGHTAAGEGGDAPDGRLSLAGDKAPAHYGVRDASAQTDFKDYFVRGGSAGREQRAHEAEERYGSGEHESEDREHAPAVGA